MTDDYTYDDLANYLDDVIDNNKKQVNGSLRDVAETVSQGTNEMADIASSGTSDPFDNPPEPIQPQANNTMPHYEPQAPEQPQMESVLQQLERLKKEKA